jgi:hypothetical protein
MGPAKLHELDDLFVERNMLLQVALGMASLCGRFEALLAEHGAGPPAAAAEPGGPGVDDHPLLDLLLGLRSFSARLLGHLEAARAAVPAAPAETPGPAPPPRESLLA